jgi:hypothetical protein
VHANRLRLYRSPRDRVYNAGDTSDRADSPQTGQSESSSNPVRTEAQTTTTSAFVPPQAASDQSHNPQSSATCNWYPVDKLLATRVRNKNRQYKVKWRDANEKPTWQNASDVSPALIRDFHIHRTLTGRKRRRRQLSYNVDEGQRMVL